jgi:hypothetical protein
MTSLSHAMAAPPTTMPAAAPPAISTFSTGLPVISDRFGRRSAGRR